MAVKKTRLDFGAWEPDAALLNGQQAPEARNVIPAKRGYRPLYGSVPLAYDALPSQVKAAYSQRDLYGTNTTFAATTEGIYTLEGKAWTQKYTGSTASNVRAFTEYGNAVYALFGSTLLKSSVAGVAQNFEEVEDAPAGDVVAVIDALYEPWLNRNWTLWSQRLPDAVNAFETLAAASKKKNCTTALIVACGMTDTVTLTAPAAPASGLLARLTQKRLPAASWLFE